MVSFYQLAAMSCAAVLPAALAQNVAPRQNFLDTLTTGTATEAPFSILPIGPLPTPSGLLTETGSMSILPVGTLSTPSGLLTETGSMSILPTDIISTGTQTTGIVVPTGTPAVTTSTQPGAGAAVNANNGQAAAVVAIGGLIAGFAEYGLF